jgi:hypothetical protein
VLPDLVSASVVVSALFLALVVAFVVLDSRARRKRARMFAACGERLGAQDFVHTPSSLAGKVRGLPIDVRFVPGTKSTPPHTTIEVACGPSAILLALRLQDADEERTVARGEAVDVVLGDPTFDATWIVEGAPIERVKRVLASAALRARLLAFARLEAPTATIEEGKVSLAFRGTEVGEDEVAIDRMELSIALAEAVIADARAPLGPGEVDGAASGHRDAQVLDAGATGASTIAELQALRAARAIRELRPAAIAGSSVVLALMVGTRFLEGPQAIVPRVVLLGAALVLGAGIGSRYRAERARAPGVPHDALAIGWMAACGVIDLLVVTSSLFG